MAGIPGLAVLTDKVPEITTPRGIARAVVTVLVIAGVALAALVIVEAWSPVLALVLQIAVYVLTYWLISQAVFGRRLRLSYADAFFTRFLPSVGLNLASALYVLLCNGWILGLTYVPIVPKPLAAILDVYLVVTGLLLILRVVQLAGVDTLFLVYNYYPDEGRRHSGSLYRLIRHPVYAGMDRLVLALALWNGSAYALLLAVLFIFAWHPRWYGLEEEELLERFGEEYRTYRERVPAVFPLGARGEVAMVEALTRRSAELLQEGDGTAPPGPDAA
jgi:protein-S-isoprenylcysteine O-methyltransferase Ste14